MPRPPKINRTHVATGVIWFKKYKRKLSAPGHSQGLAVPRPYFGGRGHSQEIQVNKVRVETICFLMSDISRGRHGITSYVVSKQIMLITTPPMMYCYKTKAVPTHTYEHIEGRFRACVRMVRRVWCCWWLLFDASPCSMGRLLCKSIVCSIVFKFRASRHTGCTRTYGVN